MIDLDSPYKIIAKQEKNGFRQAIHVAGRDGCLWGSRGGAEKIPQAGARRAAGEDDFFRRGAADPLRPKEKCGGGSRVLPRGKGSHPAEFVPRLKGALRLAQKKPPLRGLAFGHFFRVSPLTQGTNPAAPTPPFLRFFEKNGFRQIGKGSP